MVAALDVLPGMTANRSTRTAGLQSGDAPIAAQSIHFDARDRLTGDLDDTTVRQAAEEHRSTRLEPTLKSLETRFQNSDLAESAEVGR